MRIARTAAVWLLALALLPIAARAEPPAHPEPIRFVEHRLAFLVPGPTGPEVLEIAALAPQLRGTAPPPDPRALAAQVLRDHPGAVELEPSGATAAFNLDGVRWRDPVVPWWYAPAGSTPALDPKAAFDAISAGADAWRFAGGTPVRFDFRGETEAPTGCRGDPAATGYTRDGLNVVGWGDIAGGYMGYACWWRGTSLVEGTPFFELLEFDIVFQPVHPYSASVLQALALHEFGHALGLGHSDACPGAAMCPAEGALVHLEPQPDDIAGLVGLYGRAPPPRLPPQAVVPLVARD
jgi:hypothetical protein